MIDILGTATAILTALSSGAGGGILGGIFGLFKQSQERKERVEMARIDLERDQAGYANDKAEREHALLMLEQGGKIEIEKASTEAEAAIEVANQKTLASASVAEFQNLNTSSWMDNFRASIRPVLALWAAVLFTVMLSWAFHTFADNLTPDEGKTILIGLFGTLSFTVASVVTFYYVSRRNASPRI